MVTLLASCEMHRIEPLGYTRDLFRLLPNWPVQQALKVTPATCRRRLSASDMQRRLDANVFPQAGLGIRESEPASRSRQPVSNLQAPLVLRQGCDVMATMVIAGIRFPCFPPRLRTSRPTETRLFAARPPEGVRGCEA